MSAYLCTASDFSVIADAIIAKGLSTKPAATLFSMLLSENMASLDHRYGPDAFIHDATHVIAIGYRPNLAATLPDFDDACLARTVSHYNYQTCEHPTYDASDVGRLIAALNDRCGTVKTECAYPWGLPDVEQTA